MVFGLFAEEEYMKIKGTCDQDKKRLGYMFWCPGCKDAHHVYVYNESPNIGPRWDFNEDLECPTFSPSIRVVGRNETGTTICHSFVRNGKIEFLSDCTHSLAGQTVEIPDWQTHAPKGYNE